MRNLAVLSDQLHAVCAASIAASSGSGSGSGSDGSPAALVSVAFDKGASLVYLLSCAGTIYCFSDEGLCLLAAHSASPAEEGEAPDLLWFELTFVAGTGSLVAVSRSGAICSLDGEQAAAAAREGRSLKAERVGVIEGGLAGAAWSPDQSRLLLVTPLSLLSMSCDWEPLQEVANAPLLQGSLAGVSWRGDGSGVAVVSTDQADGVTRVRLYSDMLELQAAVRNETAAGQAGDTSGAALLRGLGASGAVAYAPNGSLVAVPQARVRGRPQVAFLESNGLRHADLDLRLPPLPDTAGAGVGVWEWRAGALAWDLPSQLLAVELRLGHTAVAGTAVTAGTVSDAGAEGPSVVQLYCRGNYHWYLKQQWAGRGLRLLGFDAEVEQRLYMAQMTAPFSHSGSDSDGGIDGINDIGSGSGSGSGSGTNSIGGGIGGGFGLRVVDLTWESLCSSESLPQDNSSSAAVVDGARLLLTPLAKALVPPPMCRTALSIQAEDLRKALGGAGGVGGVGVGALGACSRSLCFWPAQLPQGAGVGAGAGGRCWGLAVLEGDCIYADPSIPSTPSSTASADLSAAHLTLLFGDLGTGAPLLQRRIHLGQVLATGEAAGGARGVAGLLLRAVSVSQSGGDLLVSVLGSRVRHHTLHLTPHPPSADELLVLRLRLGPGAGCEVRAVGLVAGFGGSVQRVCAVPEEPHCLCAAVLNADSGECDVSLVPLPPLLLEERGQEQGQECGQTGAEGESAGVVWVGRLLLGEHLHPRWLACLPEPCVKLTIVPSARGWGQGEQGGQEAPPLPSLPPQSVLSLSARHRLYCGESLLASGTSSYAFQHSLGLLLHTSLGTRPHLHFCSLAQLLALDPLQHADSQDSSAQCAEARPIERGGRLLCCAGTSVVLQMPRGNLEGIEPRPLVLLRAQGMLVRGELLACLVLLRKQRLDLNYLCDFRPALFLRALPQLVAQLVKAEEGGVAQGRGAAVSLDLLCLLVTALGPEDSRLTKYRFYLPPQESTTYAAATADTASAAADTAANAADAASVDVGGAQGEGESKGEAVGEAGVGAGKEEGDGAVPGFVGDGKVNAVCAAVREALLPLLLAAVGSGGGGGGGGTVRLLQPTLCTFAMQRPPQLLQALRLIRHCCSTSTHTSTPTPTRADLSSPLAQAGIRYLCFLAQGQALFDAALGDCDFSLARAVARQCQMDPQAFLPLLAKFEVVGAGFPPHSPQAHLMRFRASLHLCRHAEALHRAVKALQSAATATGLLGELAGVGEAGVGGAITGEVGMRGAETGAETGVVGAEAQVVAVVRTVCAELLLLVQRQGLHAQVLPLLGALELLLPEAPEAVTAATATPGTDSGTDSSTTTTATTAATVAAAVLGEVNALLSSVRIAHARLCALRLDYTEGVAALLGARPVPAAEAVEMARAGGLWRLALSIAARHQTPPSPSQGAVVEVMSAAAVAQQVVAEFREGQEQGGEGLQLAGFEEAGLEGGLGLDEGLYDYCDHGSAEGWGGGGDRALEAARLAVDYCADAEAGVGILTLAQRFPAALELALRCGRMDLFAEVGASARASTLELLALLPKKEQALRLLAAEAAQLWGDPARLQQVASADVTLLEELQGEGGDHDDAASEYSAATQQSAMSQMSHSSGSSSGSRGSRGSALSGTSIVSVLSSSGLGDIKAIGSSGVESRGGSFAIEGLEHGLLSRGKAESSMDTEARAAVAAGRTRSKKAYKRDQSERRQKRVERSKAKGASRDVFGVRREASMCTELLVCVRQLRPLCRQSAELQEALLLMGTAGARSGSGAGSGAGAGATDRALAVRLQGAVDVYMEAVRHCALTMVPPAPAYPLPWLQTRRMLAVAYFQDPLMLQAQAQGQTQITQQGQAQMQMQGSLPTGFARPVVKQTWWDVAAAGLREWSQVRRTSLHATPTVPTPAAPTSSVIGVSVSGAGMPTSYAYAYA